MQTTCVTLFVWFVFFFNAQRTCNISYLSVNLKKKKVKLDVQVSEIPSPGSSKTKGNMN